MDLFEQKGIKPMLISKQVPAFNSKDFIYELKQDGIRCINYVDTDSIDLRNKRNMSLASKFPELQNIFYDVKFRSILDGEIIVIKNGVPDFYEVQRRVMMNDPFKIKLASEMLPASFVAYDVLYSNDKQITDLPLLERKNILNDLIKENYRIAVSRYVHEYGIELYNLTCEMELEGVVAKEVNSKYYFDKKSKDWLKIKRMADEDFVICGYAKNANNASTLMLGQYRGNTLIYKGSVSFGVRLNFLNEYKCKKIDYSPFNLAPSINEDITWLEPTLVCVVQFMPNTKEALRQPVFKGIRDDISPIECQVKT